MSMSTSMDTMEPGGSVPSGVVIPWLVENASTNAELAVLTNINREWRSCVATVLVENAASAKARAASAAEKSSPSKQRKRSRRRPMLLLPSLIASIVDEGMAGTETKSKMPPNKHHTFCLSWFHPDGIRLKPVALDRYDDVPGGDEIPPPQRHSNSPPTNTADPIPTISLVEIARSVQDSSSHALCMYQWDSYTKAADVLAPFGYTEAFVESIIALCQQKLKQSASGGQQQEQQALKDEKEQQEQEQAKEQAQEQAQEQQIRNESDPQATNGIETTIAVRGAAFARPEGYCFCWDTDSLLSTRDERSNADSPTRKQLFERRRLVRRCEVQREVLPRVILTNPYRRQLIGYRPGEEQVQTSPPWHDTNKENVCIQFLDANCKHAVRLITLPFACGPIATPITVFCVGIATEDGCFFSSLNHSFEFGHMHPSSRLDTSTERSGVCMCTEDCRYYNYNPGAERSDHNDTNEEAQNSEQYDDDCSDNNEEEEEDHSHDHANVQQQRWPLPVSLSDDSSLDKCLDDDIALSCTCQFKHAKNWGEDDSTSNEDDNLEGRTVHRGYRGPGSWHCYTIVYDGADSMIRIDGVTEKLRSERPSTKAAWNNAPPGTEVVNVPPTLDGFTIGSDHTFNMSLCFGQGSDGEGEGAMSEMVAFKGRLSMEDMEVMERHLMKKHDICPPEPGTDSKQLVHEDQLSKYAHYLLSHPPQHKHKPAESTKTIPLRYLARNSLVAWKQYNPVTGDFKKIQKIGVRRYHASSSDW